MKIKITKEDVDQIGVHFMMIVIVAASFIKGLSIDLLLVAMVCLLYIAVTTLLDIRGRLTHGKENKE